MLWPCYQWHGLVDERWSLAFNRPAYREHATLEWLINRLKQFRCVATGYDKRAASYRAMVTIAAIMLWL